jgi:VWFA-related protein
MLLPAVYMLLQAAQVPTFATQIQLVGVTVSVADVRNGAPVSNLKKEDFAVLEDGKQQDIQYFALETVPASVLILLDTSGSMRDLFLPISEAAARLIRSLRPIDEVHVAAFDDDYHTLCDFTTDHEAAVRALDAMVQGEGTAFNRSVYTATRYLEQREKGNIQRRRILILLSDGENTHPSFSYEMAEDALKRSQVICYVVHLLNRGLVDAQLVEVRERASRFVRSIVYESGGQLVEVPFPFNTYIIQRAFNHISDELGTQYYLSYASSADPDKAGWRAISVVLNSRRGVRLQYRKGYYMRISR